MSTTSAVSLYRELGVAEDAPAEVIRAAYRAKMRRVHPDSDSGNETLAQRVNDAYAILSDPSRRAAYDRQLAAEREPVLPAAPAVVPDVVIEGAPKHRSTFVPTAPDPVLSVIASKLRRLKTASVCTWVAAGVVLIAIVLVQLDWAGTQGWQAVTATTGVLFLGIMLGLQESTRFSIVVAVFGVFSAIALPESLTAALIGVPAGMVLALLRWRQRRLSMALTVERFWGTLAKTPGTAAFFVENAATPANGSTHVLLTDLDTKRTTTPTLFGNIAQGDYLILETGVDVPVDVIDNRTMRIGGKLLEKLRVKANQETYA